MSTPAHVVIETLTYVAPFGLGLWDVAAGKLVSEDLEVRVFALSARGAYGPITAIANHSGVFVGQNFPLLRDFEAGAGDAEFWSSLPPSTPYLVEVRDPLRRYTPFVMRVDLPRRGLAVPRCVAALMPPPPFPPSPPTAPAYVPVFGTAARRVPAGMTAVRATLFDADTGGPAELAVLEVRESGRLIGRGISDARGEVAAVFAYPEPPDAPPASSPVSSPLHSPFGASATGAQPLTQQTWALDIALRYQRNLPRYTPDRAKPALADLCEIIEQPLAVVTSSPPTILSPATLRYGQELVLGAEHGAQLFIRPV